MEAPNLISFSKRETREAAISRLQHPGRPEVFRGVTGPGLKRTNETGKEGRQIRARRARPRTGQGAVVSLPHPYVLALRVPGVFSSTAQLAEIPLNCAKHN